MAKTVMVIRGATWTKRQLRKPSTNNLRTLRILHPQKIPCWR